MTGVRVTGVAIVLILVFSSASPGGEIEITVDPRIELLAVVQYLSGYDDRVGLITDFEFEYKRGIADYFGSYSGHPAVIYFDRLSQSGFSFDAPPSAMLFLTDPPELEQRYPFTQYITNRAGGKDRLAEFVEMLRSFAVDTDFMRFYASHRAEYDSMIEAVQLKLGGHEYAQMLEEYYGMEQNGYYIVLAPLFHPGGFGPRVEVAGNLFDVYSIVGPQGVSDDLPDFGTEEGFRHMAVHEFSHSFVNPTTSGHRDRIMKYDILYNPIAEKMTKMAYPNWETCVNEHLVRAITIRIEALYMGDTGFRDMVSRELAQGFIYVPAILEALEKYEANRDLYADFTSFYPTMIGTFRNLSEMDAGELLPGRFDGPINAGLDDKSNTVIIVPTSERTEEANKRIFEYAELVRDKYFTESDIIADTVALKLDLSDFSIVAYGTVWGNRWLLEHRELFPFSIYPDSLVADSSYVGGGYRFITSLRNPYAPARALIIYTATDADSVHGINSVFHGPTDWIVGKGRNPVSQGFYDKSTDFWAF